MRFVESARNLFVRFRYPVSLPQEIGAALGVHLANSWNFRKVLEVLIDPRLQPLKLKKFMERSQAERLFRQAWQSETFGQKSLFYFYFRDGWVEFELQFDDNSKLRRVYLHHKWIDMNTGIEIRLIPEKQPELNP